MATVQVDLSEYDMIREAKENAEKELKEAKKQIESLKKNASCVIRTRYLKPNIDTAKVSELATEKYGIEIERESLCGNIFYRRSKDLEQFHKNILSKSIRYGIEEEQRRKVIYKEAPAYVETHMSEELVGFEEMRLHIEDIIKGECRESMEAKSIELEAKISEYNSKIAKAESKAQAIYQRQIDSRDEEIERLKKSNEDEVKKLEEKLDETKKAHEDEVKKLEEKLDETKKAHEDEVKQLKNQLAEAQKTQEEKIAEAEEKVRSAIEELDVLRKATKTTEPEEKPKKKLFGLFG